VHASIVNSTVAARFALQFFRDGQQFRTIYVFIGFLEDW
jgi:hypothetical protein